MTMSNGFYHDDPLAAWYPEEIGRWDETGELAVAG